MLKNYQGETKRCVTVVIRESCSRPKTYGSHNKIPKSKGFMKNRSFLGERLAFTSQVFLFPNLDRTAKQLREHYIGYLRPNINNSEWTIEEDLKLIELFNQHGKRWKFFESFFKGRTENQLKNRYYGRLEKLHFRKIK